MIIKENAPLDSYLGRNITDTNHSIERSYEREYVWKRDEYVFLHLRMVKQAILKILTDYKDRSAYYVLYSKSTGLGVVISWRKDRFKDWDEKNHAYITTVLPPQDYPHYLKNPDDIRILVEQGSTFIIELD